MKKDCQATSFGKIIINGCEFDIQEGDTVGTCLMRGGILITHRSYSGEPRGIYCAIGICNGCLVTIDGLENIRACVTKARPGMIIQTERIE